MGRDGLHGMSRACVCLFPFRIRCLVSYNAAHPFQMDDGSLLHGLAITIYPGEQRRTAALGRYSSAGRRDGSGEMLARECNRILFRGMRLFVASFRVILLPLYFLFPLS